MADELNRASGELSSTESVRGGLLPSVRYRESPQKLSEINENHICDRDAGLAAGRRNESGNIASSVQSSIDRRRAVPYRGELDHLNRKYTSNTANSRPSNSSSITTGLQSNSLGHARVNTDRQDTMESCKQDHFARGNAARDPAARSMLRPGHAHSSSGASSGEDEVTRTQEAISDDYQRRLVLAEAKEELTSGSPFASSASALSAAPDKKSQNQKLRPAKSTLQRMKGDGLDSALIESEHGTGCKSGASSYHDEGQQRRPSSVPLAHGPNAGDGCPPGPQHNSMGTQFGFYPFPAHQQPGMRLAGPVMDRNNMFGPRANFTYGFEQRFLDASNSSQQPPQQTPQVYAANAAAAAAVAQQQHAAAVSQAAEQHNNSYRFGTSDMLSSSNNNGKPSAYRPQMFLQPPRQLVFGPGIGSFPGHFQGTPSSEEGSSISPSGDNSPYVDGGQLSPKSDDQLNYDNKHRHKAKSESANQCSQCGKAFSSSSALAKHKLIHSEERRYVCQTCSKGFKRQDHLNGHMITHRDKKPYECRYPECDKSYCDMRSLRRHLENHHQAIGLGEFPTSTSPPYSVHHNSIGMMSARPHYLDVQDQVNAHSVAESMGEEMERPSSLPNAASVGDTKLQHSQPSHRSSSDDDTHSSSSRVSVEQGAMSQGGTTDAHTDLPQGDGTSDAMKAMHVQVDHRNMHHYRDASQQQQPSWNGTNPYLLQSYMAQRFPWSNQAFAGNLPNQTALPFLMGLQHQQQQQQQAQQYYPPSCFASSLPGGKPDVEQKSKRKANETCDMPANEDNAFPPNSLPVYPGSFPARRGTVLTPEMLMQNNSAAHPFYANTFGTPTNPTAIAVAAAKNGGFYYSPRENMYAGGVVGGQYPQMHFDGSVNRQHMPSPSEATTTKSPAVAPSNALPLSNSEPSPAKLSVGASTPDRHTAASPKDTHHHEKKDDKSGSCDDTVFRGPPSSVAPGSGRKAKPHPGPIVIPASVNNKALHMTSSSSILSASKGDSPSKMVIPGLFGGSTVPVYTPPAMLSPRSIFFAGTCVTPRSSQTPSTPARLLNSARRLSVLDTPEESEMVFPEPKINVGPQFQASIPSEIAPQEEAANDVHRASLLWMPVREDAKRKGEIEAFLELSRSSSLFGGSSNLEYALHILHRKRGNMKEAIRLLLSRRHILRADDVNGDYHYLGSARWSAKERLAFRLAFRQKRKVFADIQKEVGTKTVAQCVEFYYLWKAVNPEGFRSRTRCVEVESEQEEEEPCSSLPLPCVQTSVALPPDVSTMNLSPNDDSGLYTDASYKHDGQERLFECDYPECRARFVSRQALNGHIRVHGGSFSKPIEAKRAKPNKPMVIITPSPGKCQDGMTTPRKRKSPSPAPRQPRPPAPPAMHSDGTLMQFACKVCGRVFNKVKSRSAHMKTHVVKRTDDSNDHLKRPSVITLGVKLEP